MRPDTNLIELEAPEQAFRLTDEEQRSYNLATTSTGQEKFERVIDFTTQSAYDSFQSAALEAIRQFRAQPNQQAVE